MNGTKVFLTIRETCQETGLSMFFLRKGCKEGRIPHMMSGNRVLINYPLLMERMNAECGGNVNDEGRG